MYFVRQNGTYYEGDRESLSDIETTQRPSDEYTYSGGSWVANIPMMQQRKMAEMRLACQQAIESGIENDALGTAHTYHTNGNDQQNMTSIALISGNKKIWCKDVSDVLARRTHNPAKINQVNTAIRDHIDACQDNYEAKLVQIAAAATKEAIDAIVW